MGLSGHQVSSRLAPLTFPTTTDAETRPPGSPVGSPRCRHDVRSGLSFGLLGFAAAFDFAGDLALAAAAGFAALESDFAVAAAAGFARPAFAAFALGAVLPDTTFGDRCRNCGSCFFTVDAAFCTADFFGLASSTVSTTAEAMFFFSDSMAFVAEAFAL